PSFQSEGGFAVHGTVSPADCPIKVCGTRPYQCAVPQVPVVQMAGDLLDDDIPALGALKLEIFLRIERLPHCGHTTSPQDSLLRTSSSKD
ncbi:MAG: hypothetical protein P8Z41_10640, partial [Anaerolineales bacterium]